MLESQNLWSNIIEQLYNSYEPDTIDEIFGESKKVVKVVNGLIYILVPTLYIQNKINTIYISNINKLAQKLTTSNVRFKFLTNDELVKEENKYEVVERPTTTFESNLNNSYTFDSFIVGDSNRFSHINAVKVAEQPGEYVNPLYIFGSVGIGKTHLMQSIGNYILDKDINKKVLYIQAQNYINDYVKASKTNTLTEFKEKFNNLDVLLVDDIQMLAQGPKTQNEFFNSFNNLFNNKKQIVITSDCPSNQLKDITDRLTSRFAWGLQVDINPPDLPLRIKILKRKLYESSSSTTIDDEVLEYVASLYSNIRDLEGGLRRLLSYSVILNKDINMDLVKESLSSIIQNNQQNGTNDKYENLKSTVASFYNISVDDLISKKRTSSLVIPRHIAMYLLKHIYNLSYKKIGLLFGGRDHSTVMSGCAKIDQDLKTDKDLKLAIETLKKKIN